MKQSFLFTFGLLLSASASYGQTIRNPKKKPEYESGAVHEAMIAKKLKSWAAKEASGFFDPSKHAPISEVTPCVDGKAGEFKCSNVDLYSFLSHADLGSNHFGSSSWGWSFQGREFAVIGQGDGSAFIEITKEGQIVYLGRLPSTPGTTPQIWREIRVLNNYAIIGTEIEGHHVQIFDLTKLLNVTGPVIFDPVNDITGLFTGLPIGRSHTITVPPSGTGKWFVSSGSKPRDSIYAGGLVFVDITDPTKPTFLGNQAEDGYVHDAQCLPYKGPDQRYQGNEVCYGYNEDTLTIYNVTDKAKATIISRTSYVGATYTHQGWVLDNDNQEYLIMDDELDEDAKAGPAADGFPVTYIWDIRDLEAPVQTGYFKASVKGIDHNQYILNGRSYQSNYGAGLRIVDVSSIPSDPTGKGVKEIGFFDIYPEDDGEEGGGIIDFVGSWSSYAWFDSGYIVVNTIERGVFIVKYTGQ